MDKLSVAVLALLSTMVVAALVAAAGSGAVRQASPACSSTNLATWSPDGTQIAYVGRRLHHGPLPVRAICVANADGKQAAPLPHTVCTRRCRLDLIDSSSQLVWVQPKLLLYGDDFRIFTVPVGGLPQPLGKQPGSYEQFSVDQSGDRVAAGFTNCPQCAGPVTVLDVPSGTLVGRLGGKKVDNVEASITPDGSKVVFARFTRADSPRPLGLWTASADGSHLRRIVAGGELPLWSPDGTQIAYLASQRTNGSTLRVVAPQGGKSRTLLAGVWAVYGWSPDGSQIALEQGRGQHLVLVNVQTGKMRTLLRLYFASTVAWSADSQQLLVKTQPQRRNRCNDLWRVPAGGGKPQLLRRC
jgi:Tol biopolymer transport system component